MPTEILIARFEDAATREYGAQFVKVGNGLWDVELRNCIVHELLAIKKVLKARNALAKLLPFLDHPYMTVRSEAARACLDVAPERAVPVLEAIVASEHYYDSSYAVSALEHWRERHASEHKREV
jgi:hypothetical protein